MKGCSAEPRQKRYKRGAWIKAIARPVLPKAVHVCSDHFTIDSFDERQELKQLLLCGNLKYILKPDAVSSLFPNRKAINKSGFVCSFAVSFQKTKTFMTESIFNKVASCRIKTNNSKIKFQLFQTSNYKIRETSCVKYQH